MRATWRISGIILLAGCGGANAGRSDPQACAPLAAAEASSMNVGGLGGEYSVRLVASAGAKRGETTEGRLELIPQDSAYRTLGPADGPGGSAYTFPFYGTAAVDFAAVGAMIPGDPGSADPESPGVLVIQGPDRVLLRVGSEANRRGVRRFDGAFTVLQIQQVTDGGFAGAWKSGVGTDESAGHFCATRAAG
jgi:hypothetical protein